MTFHELLTEYNLSMAELHRRFGIPKRTMENWKAGINTPPDWAMNLLQIAIDSQQSVSNSTK